MVERYDGEQLPPAHPQGPPPVADGDRVPHAPGPPLPESARRHAVRLTAVVALVVAVAITLGRVIA